MTFEIFIKIFVFLQCLFFQSSSASVESCQVGLNEDYDEVICLFSGSVEAQYCSKVVLYWPYFGIDYVVRGCVLEVSHPSPLMKNPMFFLMTSSAHKVEDT